MINESADTFDSCLNDEVGRDTACPPNNSGGASIAETILGFETRALHAGYDPYEHNGSMSVPIYQSAA